MNLLPVSETISSSHPAQPGQSAILPRQQITYRISPQLTDDAPTIETFLRQKGFSHRLLAQIKRLEGGICCNDVPVPVSAPLLADALLRVKIPAKQSEEERKGRKEKTIEETDCFDENKMLPSLPETVYLDEDILVVSKPAGLAVHSTSRHPGFSLARFITLQDTIGASPLLKASSSGDLEGAFGTFHCITRLDKDTSGLVLIARHALSACILGAGLARQEIRKVYLAIVEGKIEEPGLIDRPIARAPEQNSIRRIIDAKTGQQAITAYFPVRYFPGTDLTLLKVYPKTGRTHQIRLHMQAIGHPVVNDPIYHSTKQTALFRQSCDREETIRKGQALHASGLSFIHPITGIPLSFTAPLPADLMALLS